MPPIETLLIDLDDTLCDTAHRHHLAEESKWEEYSLACVDDPPIEFTIDLVRHWDATYDIWLVSGRSEVAITQTKDWLARNGVPWFGITLRKVGNRDNNAKFKRKVALGILARGGNIKWAMDDNPGVIPVYAKLGIATLLIDRPQSPHTPQTRLDQNTDQNVTL